MKHLRTRIVVEFPLDYDPAQWPDVDELTCTVATYFECVLGDTASDFDGAGYAISRDPTVWISPQAYLLDMAERWNRRRHK